jgi:hypothetical protein
VSATAASLTAVARPRVRASTAPATAHRASSRADGASRNLARGRLHAFVERAARRGASVDASTKCALLYY